MGQVAARGNTEDQETVRLAAALMQRMIHQGMTGLSLSLSMTLAPREGGAMRQADGLLIVELDGTK